MQSLSAARFYADEEGLLLAEQWLSDEFMKFDFWDRTNSVCYNRENPALPLNAIESRCEDAALIEIARS